MSEPMISSKFNVDDIRALREYDDTRRRNMDVGELVRDIRKEAEEGHSILAHFASLRQSPGTRA